MPAAREIKEGTQYQGIDEIVCYSIDVTNWTNGVTPTSATVKAYDITADTYTDVTSTVLSGSATIALTVISLPILSALTEAHTYRIEVKLVASGNTLEPYFYIQCEK